MARNITSSDIFISRTIQTDRNSYSKIVRVVLHDNVKFKRKPIIQQKYQRKISYPCFMHILIFLSIRFSISHVITPLHAVKLLPLHIRKEKYNILR